MSGLKGLVNGHSSEGQGERGGGGERLVHGMKHVDIEIRLTTGVRSRQRRTAATDKTGTPAINGWDLISTISTASFLVVSLNTACYRDILVGIR